MRIYIYIYAYIAHPQTRELLLLARFLAKTIQPHGSSRLVWRLGIVDQSLRGAEKLKDLQSFSKERTCFFVCFQQIHVHLRNWKGQMSQMPYTSDGRV